MKSSRQLLPLFFIIFIDALAYFLVIPVYLRLFMAGPESILAGATSTTLRNTLFGLAVAISPLASLITGPLLGSLSDRVGRKKTLMFCLLGSCLGFAIPILGISQYNLSLVLFGRLVAGASDSSQAIAQAAITDLSQGKQRAWQISLIALAMTSAMVIGPLLGGYLSDKTLTHWFTPATPFVIGLILSILNLGLLQRYFTETLNVTSNTLLHSHELRQAFTQLFRVPPIRLLLLTFFCLEFAFAWYYQAVPLVFSQHYHLSTDTIADLMAYIGLSLALGLTLGFRLSLRYLSLSHGVASCLLGIGVSLLAILITKMLWLQWFYIIPLGIFFGMAYPSLVTLMSEHVSTNQQGCLMGLNGALVALSWLVSGMLLGGVMRVNQLLGFELAIGSIVLAGLCYLGWTLRIRGVGKLFGGRRPPSIT